MSSPQVAPSEFSFGKLELKKSQKFESKEREKWVDQKPFFGGFNKETKNHKSSIKDKEDEEKIVLAGGFNPISRQTQRDNFLNKNKEAEGSKLLAAGVQFGTGKIDVSPDDRKGDTYYEHHSSLTRPESKKKRTPGGAGFKIDIIK